MCWQLGLPGLGSDGRCDHGGAVAVARIVLNDQDRTDAALLAAHHRGEIGIVNIAALDTCIHKVHTPPKEVPVTEVPSVRPLSFSHAGPEFILCLCRKIPASSPRTILCPGRAEREDRNNDKRSAVSQLFTLLTAAAGSAPRSCRPPDIPAALACSPRRSGPTAHGAAGTPRFYFGRPGRARPPQGFAARGKTLGRRTRGDSLLCAYNRCRLRSTILPSSRYTRGTRLLTAQISS